MHAQVNLKCPEHGQGSWIARVRIGEDASAEVLGYADSRFRLLQEKIARALYEMSDVGDDPIDHFDTVAERIVEEALDYSVSASTERVPDMDYARTSNVQDRACRIHGHEDCDECKSFDPDELVRWAETYGHPEEWAQKAKAANERAERAFATAQGVEQCRKDAERSAETRRAEVQAVESTRDYYRQARDRAAQLLQRWLSDDPDAIPAAPLGKLEDDTRDWLGGAEDWREVGRSKQTTGSLRLSSEQIAESYSLAQAVQNEIGFCGAAVIAASVQPLARNDPRIEPK